MFSSEVCISSVSSMLARSSWSSSWSQTHRRRLQRQDWPSVRCGVETGFDCSYTTFLTYFYTLRVNAVKTLIIESTTGPWEEEEQEEHDDPVAKATRNVPSAARSLPWSRSLSTVSCSMSQLCLFICVRAASNSVCSSYEHTHSINRRLLLYKTSSK